MDLKDKAKVFMKCANAIKLPLDLVSAEVLLILSDKIDEKGDTISIRDLEDIVEPYLIKQENNLNNEMD